MGSTHSTHFPKGEKHSTDFPKGVRILLFWLAAVVGTLPSSAMPGNGIERCKEVMTRMLHSPEFEGAGVSILALTADGDTLLAYDPDRQLIPASNMKLVTTALALHSLGTDYRWETRLGYDGQIVDGTLEGDLYIVGGGDPTLGSHNRIAEPVEEVFQRWMLLLKSVGINAIDGYIIGDGRFFPGMKEQESWQINDCGTYYGTGVSGLSFYENVQDFRVEPGEKVGAPLRIRPTWPETPWMDFRYACTTGPKGSANTLYFYTSDFAAVGEMRGSFPLGRKAHTESAANKFPEYTIAHYFCKYLASCGIESTMGPADLGIVFGPGWTSGQKELTFVGGTKSPSLGKVVGVTNRESNNLYAETLLKTLGKEYTGAGVYDSAYVAVNGLLEELGVRKGHVRIVDGSGLSRAEHVSAAFMCDLLFAMTESPAWGDYLESLPRPGGEGTLKYMMGAVPQATRMRIRMKSGSMSDVRCYSGYILGAEAGAGTASAAGAEAGSGAGAGFGSAAGAGSAAGDYIVFSILVNNFTCSNAAIQKKLEELILSLVN